MKASEIKKEARKSLTGKWKKGISIVFIYLSFTILVGTIQRLIQTFIGEESNFKRIIDVTYFIISIPLSFGLTISFIKLKRGEDVSAFSSFKEGFFRFVKSWTIWFYKIFKLFLPIFTVIFVIIFTITSLFISIANSNYLPLAFSIITFIIALIWLICKSLLYSLAYYISYDHPELSAKECIYKSAKLMKGNRIKYFCLNFSFIGWILLQIISFIIIILILLVVSLYFEFELIILSYIPLIIGKLFLTPYIEFSTIYFYEKICNE